MIEDADKSLVNHNHRTHSVEIVRNVQNGKTPKKDVDVDPDEFSPPDGGTRAWLVMLGSFFCNGILFGIINSYSKLYDTFKENLVAQNVTDPSSKAALVGSLTMGTTFFVSAFAGVLTDWIGLRTTTFLGGAIASGGMFLSSYCVDNITLLCITFGIMVGLGAALAYTPSLAVLGHYFKKYLGVVNGIVTAGSSVFTIVMPYIITYFLECVSVNWTLRLLAIIISLIMGCSFLFKPLNTKTDHRKKVALSSAFNTSVLKNKKYVIWAVSIGMSLFGYFVPYVHISSFVKTNFDQNVDSNLPILCVGLASGVGRLIFGYLADRPEINKIVSQQIAFLTIGILTMLLPASSGHTGWLIVIMLGMGLVDGCFISLIGPIAFEMCGQDGAAQAIGFLFCICSFPLMIGPTVAGAIYEQGNSYTLPFVLAGVPPIVGAFTMLLMRFVKTGEPKQFDLSQQPLRCVTTSKSEETFSKSEIPNGHAAEDGSF